MAISMDSKIWLVTQFQHMTPGNLRAFMAVKLKDLVGGGIIDKRFRSGEEVEQAVLDRRELEYLYSDPNGAVFMDASTYDQAVIPSDVLGSAMDYLKPNAQVIGLVYKDAVISIELPKTVDLIVTGTAPGIKGATATNQLKDATCETGLKTRVPPFIKQGEVIRVSTESGEYQSRAGG